MSGKRKRSRFPVAYHTKVISTVSALTHHTGVRTVYVQKPRTKNVRSQKRRITSPRYDKRYKYLNKWRNDNKKAAYSAALSSNISLNRLSLVDL